MHLPNIRQLYFLGFVICALLIAVALYFQFYLNMEPCPLCIFQRVIVLLLALVCLIASLHNSGRLFNRAYAVLCALLSLSGAALAARHVWLQNLPEELVPTCGPGLGYMLDAWPVADVLKEVFTGSGECAEVVWRFLGLTIPGWTLLFFVLFIAASFFQLMRTFEKNSLR